jgi:hypothetical protein
MWQNHQEVVNRWQLHQMMIVVEVAVVAQQQWCSSCALR